MVWLKQPGDSNPGRFTGDLEMGGGGVCLPQSSLVSVKSV